MLAEIFMLTVEAEARSFKALHGQRRAVCPDRATGKLRR